MINHVFHNVEHNSIQHQQMRLGIPTSSEFGKIITPVYGEDSKQWDSYMYRLLAEWIAGQPLHLEDGLDEGYQSPYMKRGIYTEDQAVHGYEFLADLETSNGGFWTTLDGMAGCSPDRMILSEGVLEIKCPGLPEQVRSFFEGVPHKHRCQLQGQLWITGRQWVDIYSYHPSLPLSARRVQRDDQFIGKLQNSVKRFIDVMMKRRGDLERENGGPFHRPKAKQRPFDPAQAGFQADWQRSE